MWAILVTAQLEKVGTLRSTDPLVRKILNEGIRSLTPDEFRGPEANEPVDTYNTRITNKIFNEGVNKLSPEDMQLDSLPELGKAGYLGDEVIVVVLEGVPKRIRAMKLARQHAQIVAPQIAECVIIFSQKTQAKLRRLTLELVWLPKKGSPQHGSAAAT